MPVRLILALTLALLAIPAAAHALPCQTCGVEPPPIDPIIIDPGDVTTESVSHTLTVASERGRITDGSGLDCPGVTCTRTLTFSRTCINGGCPPYSFSTVTLALEPVEGYTAKWDGCTPHGDDPTRCDVALDQDRTVQVLWAKGAAAVDPLVVHDGGPVNQVPAAATTIVSGTVETGTATGPRKPGAIRSTLRYSFRRSDTWTEFTKLAARNVPDGAAIKVRCRGAGCPAGPLTLKALTGRRFAPGTVIVVRVTKPGRKARVTQIKVRAGKDPRITHPE